MEKTLSSCCPSPFHILCCDTADATRRPPYFVSYGMKTTTYEIDGLKSRVVCYTPHIKCIRIYHGRCPTHRPAAAGEAEKYFEER